MEINLDTDDLMAATEASVRWGKNEGYVRQQFVKYPEKFKKGTIRKFGKTYLITREGMEHLVGMTELEAKNERNKSK
ncbi:helix-turn-helix domain-containing protein [Enterococcus rivorum]|uniref:helix-turn-helix domain-containing protein n=1 Tax=Enterococcus rivorum TaxID=762845 RepID=UPI001FDF7273|nr:helix-turn-helix domain-containing protein [Enterococcus rivorum]